MELDFFSIVRGDRHADQETVSQLTVDDPHRNFDFGIDYLSKAFNPMHKKPNAHTWFYANKCLFELLRSMGFKQYIMPDSIFDTISGFFAEVDKNGKKIVSIIDFTVAAEEPSENQTISFRARATKAMLLRMFRL
jgi:tetratricopeptide repeat protein 30